MKPSDQAAPAAGRPGLTVSLHGPGVTIEDAMEAGQATKKLLDAIGEQMGVGEIGWQVTSVEFRCDGCDLRRPNRPGPDEGWSHSDGDDYCPACTRSSDPSQPSTA